jgi:ATP-dependent Clp protease ATP-binding subunit ClpA
VAALEADDPRCKRIGFYAHREPQYLAVAERLGAEPVEKRVLFGRWGLANIVPNQFQGRPADDSFTDDVVDSIVLAADEAILMGHTWIGTEHLMLGLWRLAQGAGSLLRRIRIDVDLVRERVAQMVGSASESTPTAHPDAESLRQGSIASARERVKQSFGEGVLRMELVFPPFTPRALRVIELAQAAADELNDDRVSSEHLLMAVIREGAGVGVQALATGQDVDAIYRQARESTGWGQLATLVREALDAEDEG